MEEKYTKVIAVGDEAINYLENIKHNLQKNASFENIKVTKDVDKEFVRGLLDGIEVLYMLYDSSDKDVVNILKAISFMAQERRVLCIGLDICLKENKEDDRNAHYLGREYMYYGRWNDAIDTLIKHLRLESATWKDERCASMRFISRCYKNLNRYDEAEMWLLKAIKEAPY